MRRLCILFTILCATVTLIIGCSKDTPPPPNDTFTLPGTLLNQTLKPADVNFTKEEYTNVRISGKSRFGTLTLQSDESVLLQANNNINRYTGNFDILYHYPDGSSMKIARLDETSLDEDVHSWQWRTIECKGFDLMIFQANQTEFYKHEQSVRNIRIFAVTETKDAFPISFQINNDGAVLELDEITIQSGSPLLMDNKNLTVYSPLPELHELVFEIDMKEKIAKLIQVENVDQSYRDAKSQAEEQAKILEQILFFEVGESQYVIDTDKKTWEGLLERVSEEAFQQESFQYMLNHKLKFQRAFYWGVSDVRMEGETNDLFFTFSANVAYALGQDARLEVHMVQENGIWIFKNFGSLYIEGLGESSQVILNNKIN